MSGHCNEEMSNRNPESHRVQDQLVGRASPPSSPEIDLDAIRAKLAGARGKRYWRSLEELAETEEFQQLFHREFPVGASEWWDGLTRRNFLKMAGVSLALAGLTACTKQRPH